MHLIIGGAYQGKLAYAKNTLKIDPAQVCDLRTDPLSAEKTCLYHIESYVLQCLTENSDPTLLLEAICPESVLICDDISCGIVPIDPLHRAWREATGRLLNTLCRRADHVTRMFCGMPLSLK